MFLYNFSWFVITSNTLLSLSFLFLLAVESCIQPNS